MRAKLAPPDMRLLLEWLTYDPADGSFKWRAHRSANARPGTSAGSVTRDGYLSIRLAGSRYQAHRLAWFYVYGKWPADQIDHINGIRDDNRIINLREATASLNGGNQRKAARSNRTSGFLGVSWSNDRGKWLAQIQSDRKTYNLGRYSTREAAYRAYLAAKRRLHSGCTI
jgi:hypothetical protein